MYICSFQSFRILVCFCSWAGWFESYLVENPRRHIFAWCGSYNWEWHFQGNFSCKSSTALFLYDFPAPNAFIFQDAFNFNPVCFESYIVTVKVSPYLIVVRGARWLSGRVSDSGARGPGFETYRRRVVSLSKTLYSPKVLVKYPGSDGSVPTWLKNCWLGR